MKICLNLQKNARNISKFVTNVQICKNLWKLKIAKIFRFNLHLPLPLQISKGTGAILAQLEAKSDIPGK